MVLSPEALDQVRDLCAGEQVPVGTGQAWVLRVTAIQPLAAATPRSSVPTPQAAGAALRGYVPGAIVARLAAGQSPGCRSCATSACCSYGSRTWTT